MEKEKEPLKFSPDMDVILQDYIREWISSSDGDTVANRVERALLWAGLTSPKGHSIGVLWRNYSRSKRKHIPAGESAPAILPAKYAWSEDMRSVREECADAMRQLLGDETPDKNYLRRLLDVPEICDRLIHHAQEYDMEVFKQFLTQSPYEFWRQQLDHTRNHARHHQAATLGSYIARTFGPDGLPPIRTKQWEKWERTMRDTLIQSLPIDPDKIAKETLIKLWLAPDDFRTYSAGSPSLYTRYTKKISHTPRRSARGQQSKSWKNSSYTRSNTGKWREETHYFPYCHRSENRGKMRKTSQISWDVSDIL
jgi:hypothetical protein